MKLKMNIDPRKFLEELRGLDQHNVGRWPLWAYAGVVGFAMALILGLGGWYFVLPKGDDLVAARAKESGLKAELDGKQHKVANLDAYKAQLEEMQRRFGTLLRQLPNQNEVPKLLNDISQTRLAAGLEEELFRPRGEINKGFYAILPSDMVVTGSYHELAGFVSMAAALPRIVTLKDIDIRPQGQDGGALRMSLLVETYRYVEAVPATADHQASKP